jgi:hypothetical protein
VVVELPAGGKGLIPALEESARAGTLQRSAVISDHPGIVKMAAAMDVFAGRPARSTGQHLDLARAWLGLGGLRETLGLGGKAMMDRAVGDALGWLPAVIDANGQVAPWPGGQGQVGLSSDALLFLMDAEDAGYDVDRSLKDGLIVALKASLRSDYRYFLSGSSWYERSKALEALASARVFDEAYFTELADATKWLGPQGQAHVLMAASRAGRADSALAGKLVRSLDDEVVVALFEGAPPLPRAEDHRPGPGHPDPGERDPHAGDHGPGHGSWEGQ